MKLLAGLAGLVALAAAAPPGPRTPLAIQLEMAGNSAVTAVITNTGETDLKIFRPGTILDKAANEKATVTAGDKAVKFEGIRQRIATNHLNDTAFEHIPAGQSINVTFDIARVYDLSAGGMFNVEAWGVLNLAAESSTELIGSIPYHSNKIATLIDGAQAAAVRLAYARHRRTQIQRDCTGQKLSVSKSALSSCAKLSLAARKAAMLGPASKLREYFKDSSYPTRKQVADVFSKVADECGSTKGGVSRYYCTDIEDACEQGVLAYTIPTESIMVSCDLYFSTLTLVTQECHGQDQATTSLHECTHLLQVAGTRDYGYGYRSIQRLTPKQSLDNADSYALFANAIHVGC